MILSDLQYCALDAGRHWVVRAGAGAGKTRVLTERYQHLLSAHPELAIDQVLALTFTQKAAEEMKARIAREITGSRKETFHRNQISTIDSFCVNLLRMYPIEAEVDADFGIVNEFEYDQLLNSVYLATLEPYIRIAPDGTKTDENRRMLHLLEWLEQRPLQRLVLRLMKRPQAYEAFALNYYRIAQYPGEFMKNLTEAFEERLLTILELDEILPKLSELKAFLGDKKREVPAVLTEITQALSAKPLDLAHLQANLTDWVTRLRAEPRSLPGAPYSCAKLREHLEGSGLLSFDPGLDETALSYLGDLISLTNAVQQNYEIACRRRNVLDFSSVKRKAAQLLQNHPRVAQALHEKYRYLLVDEFQDTDPTQWEILQALRSEKLFIVGDEKQAIYGFRGGDVQIFRRAQGEILANNSGGVPLFFEETEPERTQKLATQLPEIRKGLLDLNENYRSHPVPIAFFNAFFAQLFEPQKGADPEPQTLKSMKPANEAPGSVRILAIAKETSESEGDSDELQEDLTDQLREAHLIAQFVKETLAKRDPATRSPSIGILFRRFTEIKTYEEVLRQSGVDFLVHRGKGFFNRQEIIDLYNLLVFLNDSRRDINLVGVLRTPVFGLTDSEIVDLKRQSERAGLYYYLKDSSEPKIAALHARLRSWLELKDRLRISELLRRIIADTSWNAVFGMGARGRQSLHNVEKFIEMAREYEVGGIRGLADFCEYIREQIDTEEKEGEAALDFTESPPVVMMTIHQSKGLEFPMVILPDLNARFQAQKDDVFDALPVLGGYFLGISCPNPKKAFEKEPTMAKLLLREQAKRNQIAEEKRLFYVGVTRAMQDLVLVGRARAEKKIEPKNFENAGCVWDWLEQLLHIHIGKDTVQVMGQGPEYPVRWFEKSNIRGEKIDAVTLAEPDFNPGALLKRIAVDPLTIQKGIHVSPTALGVLSDCERKYYFRDVLKVSESFAGMGVRKDLSGSESDEEDLNPLNSQAGAKAKAMGTVVHELLKDLPSLQSPQALRDENLAFRLNRVLRLDDDKERLELQRDIRRHVESFTQSELFATLVKLPPERIHSELPFKLEVNGIWLSGTIDKLYQLEAGGPWTILDFKTNRKPEIAKHHYDLQLNCYARAAEEILGAGQVSTLQLFFTYKGQGLYPIKKDLAAVDTQLTHLRVLMGEQLPRSLDLKPPVSDELCKNCPYQKHRICDYERKV